MLTALWVSNGVLLALVIWLALRWRAQGKSQRTSEQQYRIIFETVTDGLIINSLDGVVVEANPAACKMHGYTREQFLGKSAAEFVHPDSLHLFREYVESLSAGRTFHCFAQDLRKDGSVFDVEVDGIPFHFEGMPHLLGIVRDVTDRLETMRALTASEELNRRIVEAVPAGIVRVAQNGAILLANEIAQEFLGLSLNKLTKRYVNDYENTSFYEDGRVCPVEEFPVSRCLTTGERHGPLTLGVSQPDGRIAWAVFSAVPLTDPETDRQTGGIVTFLDITARKEAEQELLESEERFRLLAENAPSVVYLCKNDARYTMLYLNEAVEQLTGYPKDDFLNDRISFVDLYHPDDKEQLVAEVNQALESRQPFRLHYRIWHRSGEFRWISEVGVGVWRDGELAFLEGFLDDITERVRADEALKKAQEQLSKQQAREHARVKAELERVQDRLVQSTRLATIGKMAAQIAHEIRNPLGTIKNSAFFVRRKLSPEEKIGHENLNRIESEVGVCVQIIENILNITRIQQPRKSPLELRRFFEESFERLHSTGSEKDTDRSLQCEYREQAGLSRVEVDHVQFRQVVDNLLKNAVEAMGRAGRILVAAKETASDTIITICDSGPGVEPDQAERIFEVFQTSKPKGTGLGLGICRQIVERHGGTLELVSASETNSNPLGGAAFAIKLPRRDRRDSIGGPSESAPL